MSDKRCLHLCLGYSAAATAGVGIIEGGTNAYDHGLSFKSLSRATPCISSLKKRFLSPVVENKHLSRAVSLFWQDETRNIFIG